MRAGAESAGVRRVGRFESVSLDVVRDYWNRRPCNVRHSAKPVGSREYFDEVEARRYFVEPHIPKFAEFERWAGKRVLEIGCGIGTDTISFARAGATVTAVDVSEESIEIARQRTRVYGLENRIRFYCADAETLIETVPPEPYDLVYSFGVVHHTPHPDRVIDQVREYYVHDGSLLKLMVYHRRSWKALCILITAGRGQFWKLDELIARHSEAQTGCPVTYTYTRRGARRLLNGFHIDEYRVDFIFPYRIRDYVQYRYVRKWYLRMLPATIFGWLEHRLGWHLCITSRPILDGRPVGS